MDQRIDQETATQIAETVRDVCGYNINFIEPDGHILASTDPKRIGDYHELGHKAAKEGRVLEVSKDDEYIGAKAGVNLPFYFNGELIAVIGITGDPEEVRRYAYLAQRITSLILREKNLDAHSRNAQAACDYIVRALTHDQSLNHEYLMDFLGDRNLSYSGRYRTVLVMTDRRCNPANLSMIESDIIRLFKNMDSQLYSFVYPRKFCLIMEEEKYRQHAEMLFKFAEENKPVVRIGIGDAHGLLHQSLSCTNALMAVRSLGQDSFCAEFERLDLPLILGNVPDGAAGMYVKRTVEPLSGKERFCLQSYYRHDMSLKKTAESLFIHVNTLQYQLNRIRDKTGYNPRKFSDAAKLYLGLMLADRRNIPSDMDEQ